MGPGDRVTILNGADRLNDGELVGIASDGRFRVWLPKRGTIRSYSSDQLALLQDSRRPPKRRR